MGEFDAISDRLQESVAGMAKAVESIKSKNVARLDATMTALDQLRQLQQRVAFGSVLIVALTCFLAVFAVRRYIVSPLQWIAFTFFRARQREFQI